MRTSPTRGPWAVRPRSGLTLLALAILGVSCCWGLSTVTSSGDCVGYGHATKSFPQAYLECLQYLNLSRQSLDAYDEQANPPDSDANCLVRCVGLGTRWWDDRDGLSERALLRFFREPKPTVEQLEQARTCVAAGPLEATDHCSAAFRAFRCYSESLGELVTHPRYLPPRLTELRSAVRDCAQVLQVPEESVASYVGQSFLVDERGSKLLHCVVVRLGLYSDAAGILADRLALLPGAPSTPVDTSEAQLCETRVRDFSTDPCLVAAHSAEQCYGREAFGELWPAMVAEYGVPMAPTKPPSDSGAKELEPPMVPNQGVRSRLVYIRTHEDQTGPTQEQEPAGAQVPASGHPVEMLIADKDYDEVTKLLGRPEAPLDDSHVIRARSVMCPCYGPPLDPPYYPEFDPYLVPQEPAHFFQPGPPYPGDYPFEPPMFHPMVKRMAPYSDEPVHPMHYPLPCDDHYGRVGVQGFMPELRFTREAFPSQMEPASQNYHPYVASRSTADQLVDVPAVESKQVAATGEDAVVEQLVAQQSRSKSKAKPSAVKPVVEKEQEFPGKNDGASEQVGDGELTATQELVKEEQDPGMGTQEVNDGASEQEDNEKLTPTQELVEEEHDSGSGTPELNDGASQQDVNEQSAPAKQEDKKKQKFGKGSPVVNDGASEQDGNEELAPTQELVEEKQDLGSGTPNLSDGVPEQDGNEELTPAKQEVKKKQKSGKGSPVLNEGATEQDGNEELTPTDQGVEKKQDPETGTPELNDGASDQEDNEELTPTQELVEEEHELGSGTAQLSVGTPEQDGDEELTPAKQVAKKEQKSGKGSPDVNDGASEKDGNEESTPVEKEVKKEQKSGKGSPVVNDAASEKDGNEKLTPTQELVEEEQNVSSGTPELSDGVSEQDGNEESTPTEQEVKKEQPVQEAETPKENGSEPESSVANPEVETGSDLGTRLTEPETPEQGESELAAAQPAAPLDTTPAEVPKAGSPAPEPTLEPTATKMETVASADPAAEPKVAAPQPAAPSQNVVPPKRRGPMGVVQIIKTLARASLAA